jgi:peptide/nickel transport system permease protein
LLPFLLRALHAVPTLFGLLIVTFLLIRIVPADPAAALAGDNATPQQIENIRHQYGFDRPILEQLVLYLASISARVSTPTARSAWTSGSVCRRPWN